MLQTSPKIILMLQTCPKNIFAQLFPLYCFWRRNCSNCRKPYLTNIPNPTNPFRRGPVAHPVTREPLSPTPRTQTSEKQKRLSPSPTPAPRGTSAVLPMALGCLPGRPRANYCTRNHKSEIPSENPTDNPFDYSSKNPLDK